MSNSTIGSELEFILFDGKGFVLNKADNIRLDSRNDGSITYEATEAHVEINSDPTETVKELSENIKEKLVLLEEICDTYGAHAVPVSEFGAGRCKPKRLQGRVDVYLLTLGPHNVSEMITNSGMHLHISQFPGKELDQFCLLYALDSISFAITSTSPISYQGINSLNCHRINTIRHHSFNEFPLHAQLQDYPGQLEELERRNQKRWEQWKEIVVKKGMSPSLYDEKFQPDNTGYAPIRKRDHIGPTGTWEVRSFDVTPLDIAMAAIAFYKGCNDNFIDSGLRAEVAEEDNKFFFGFKKVVLPNYTTLKRMEEEAIHYGLKSDLVANYLNHVLKFAEQGLPLEDQAYLDPLKEMLKTRMNPADQIMQFVKSQGYTGSTFSPEQAAQANLFMRKKHTNALNSL